MLRRRISIGVLCCGLGLAMNWAIPASAQNDTKPKGDSKPAQQVDSEKQDATRKKAVPANFGKLGLNDGQRESINQIQDEYEVKLEKLREEIKKLTNERNKKIESTLTNTQRTLLKEIRAEKREDATKKDKDAKTGK
ncbi:hypothetical protein [Planctomicrobium sp. SH527]|uniref:hypothetical protein n=1 Tax=Planctomicrobium sp. SH527 TaxID=3448123 RepID=UPI003F5C5C20